MVESGSKLPHSKRFARFGWDFDTLGVSLHCRHAGALRGCRLVTLTLLLLLPACASVKPDKSSLPQVNRVWPPPPAEPRIAYVRSISSPLDLGMKPSSWSRFGNWLTGRNRNSETFTKPFAIALDELDNVCLTDTGEAAVWFFDRAQKRFQRWSAIGRIQFVAPVAVAKRNGLLFVADSGLGSVVVFDEKGKLRVEIKQGLARPSGLAIVGEKLFVADAHFHCVAVFDLAGKPLFTFGRRGAGPGEFNFPTHISTNPRGQLLVTDSLNSRVEVFDASGRYQDVIGGSGDTTGHFSRPKGVAVDVAGRVYVIDALVDNLQIFDSTGRFLLDVGGSGAGPGEFWLPNGIAIGRDNQIFVTDSYNHRVQVLKYVGPE